MNQLSPCYKCEKRYLGCHSYCKEYADWCEEKSRRANLIQAQKKQAAEVKEYIKKSINKKKRSKNEG